MNKPHVSCIMPTANRAKFVPLAIANFLNQDYRNAELIIIDDGKEPVKDLVPKHHRIKYFYEQTVSNIGTKRNLACKQAKGEIIMHWDDDDWYAGDWISRQLTAIESSGADICGLNDILFFSPVVNKFWRVVDKKMDRPWLAGATMVYRKKFWLQHPFKDVQIGEDYDYVWNTGAKIFAHDYVNGFIATLHAHNTTLKPFEDHRHKKHAVASMNIQSKGKAENPEQSKPNN